MRLIQARVGWLQWHDTEEVTEVDEVVGAANGMGPSVFWFKDMKMWLELSMREEELRIKSTISMYKKWRGDRKQFCTRV
jgi:hypothetical protein